MKLVQTLFIIIVFGGVAGALGKIVHDRMTTEEALGVIIRTARASERAALPGSGRAADAGVADAGPELCVIAVDTEDGCEVRPVFCEDPKSIH